MRISWTLIAIANIMAGRDRGDAGVWLVWRGQVHVAFGSSQSLRDYLQRLGLPNLLWREGKGALKGIKLLWKCGSSFRYLIEICKSDGPAAVLTGARLGRGGAGLFTQQNSLLTASHAVVVPTGTIGHSVHRQSHSLRLRESNLQL